MRKPPIGIIPRKLFKEDLDDLIATIKRDRLEELVNAIGRRLEDEAPIPIEWIEEYNESDR